MNTTYSKFRDIPQFPHATYQVNMPWSYIEKWIADHTNTSIVNTDLNPPYQRGYVWTEEQKERYIEFRLQGGFSGRDIFWNCPGWPNFNIKGTLELVDGKQRVDAVLGFLHDKVKAFGKYRSQYVDKLDTIRHDFIFHINSLVNEEDIVRWYLGLNRGGAIHTEKDLAPALEILKKYEK
jgi:hypothetical protein